MVAKRWKMDEDHGEEYVMLPFLADEELISISGWKRIAAAFSCVAESTNAEKRDLRFKEKVEDVWADGYVNLSNLRGLNVRTLRNELESLWPMLLARQFVRMVTAMSFVEQRDCEDKAKDVQSTDYLQEPSLAAKLTQSPNPIQMI